MEFLLIIALTALGARRYKSGKGGKPVRLNPNRRHEADVFMALYNLVMKEGRIK